jgi:Tat protein translocase TatB subunit
MFGIGLTEILLILVVALLVVGPKKLPELARTLGRGLAEFRKTADEFKESIYADEPVVAQTAKKDTPSRVPGEIEQIAEPVQVPPDVSEEVPVAKPDAGDGNQGESLSVSSATVSTTEKSGS